MHRLFVGLRPPPNIRAILLAAMNGAPGARWQDDEQLHITLRYIGEVDGRVAEDVALALDAVYAPAPTMTLSGAGRFESRGRANALWAGIAPTEQLAALHRKIDTALVRMGLDPERRAYRPHITLARCNMQLEIADRFVADHTSLASVAFTCRHFELFESHLGRERASYVSMARYPLVG